MKPKSINQIAQERREAYARGDIEGIRRAEREIELWQIAHPRKKGKGRTPGQRRYVAMLKRHGWI